MKKLVTSYRKKNAWWPLVLGTAALMIGFFLLIALGTYYYHDPSWFFATTDAIPVHNKAGIVGAYASALLLYISGVAALLWIPFFFFIAYLAFRYYDLSEHVDALVAAGVGIVATSALAQSFDVSVFGDTLPGGVVGSITISLISYVSDPFITRLFLILVLVGVVTIITRLSLIQYAYSAIRYLCSRRFLYPVGRAIASGVRTLYAWCVAIVSYFYRICKDAYGQATANAHTAPEFEDVVHKEYQDVMQAAVFSQYDQEMSDAPDIVPQNVEELPKEELAQRHDVPEHTEIVAPISSSTYRLPQAAPTSERKPTAADKAQQDADQSRAHILEEKLARFGIAGKVVSIKKGPVVTLFEYQPDIDTKISKILALEDDLALALQAMSIRIIAPIPGRSVVGFEVANMYRSSVMLASLIQSSTFTQFDGQLPIVLGVDTIGEPVIVDLLTMPHLLVAGATGSGKSVGLNTMLVSLLYKLKPSELRLILIDPKRLEFASYADIAHLLFPIITQMKDVVAVLRWLVQTMEERYTIMASCGVRHVLDYQKKAARDSSLAPMPFIVIMIDEFSDLIMTTGKDVEELIVRIAQMARAAGIHMIIATQRPSVDVITGLIKVNFPSRVAFRVTSKVDSRTILDTGGAEKLLGKGDMLFLHAQAHLARVHGAYISDNDIHELVAYIKKEQPVQYLDIQHVVASHADDMSDEDSALFKEVCLYVKTVDEISISLLQRKFRIGYNRSARIMEQLEMHGMILASDGSKMRKVVHSG